MNLWILFNTWDIGMLMSCLPSKRIPTWKHLTKTSHKLVSEKSIAFISICHRRGDASWTKNTRVPVTFGSTKSRSLATLEALKISPSGTRFAEIVSFFLYTEQAFPLEHNRNSTLWDEGNSPHLPQINRINPTGTIQLSNSDAFSGTVQGQLHLQLRVFGEAPCEKDI